VHRRDLMRGLVLSIALATGIPAWSASIEEQVAAKVEALRAVKPGQPSETIKKYNAQMDADWGFFGANRAAALPVLRRKLEAEVRAPLPNALVLMDVGYFLATKGEPEDLPLATSALLRIDTAAPIVAENQQQLFYFTHRVARTMRDEQLLAFIQKAFLSQKVSVFVPQHAMELDATLASVFLYGLQGKSAEVHLRRQLAQADPDTKLRALEVLVWIGSPDSLGAVLEAMRPPSGHQAFLRGVAFVMTIGGPGGRDAMLAIKPDRLDADSRKYYEKVKPAIETYTYAQMRKSVPVAPGDTNLSPVEIRARLAEMIRNDGRDDNMNPMAILNADVPTQELIASLEKVREVTFRRVSDEALSDVKVANALMNVLRYKESKSR
jgi:hypothetical protein